MLCYVILLLNSLSGRTKGEAACLSICIFGWLSKDASSQGLGTLMKSSSTWNKIQPLILSKIPVFTVGGPYGDHLARPGHPNWIWLELDLRRTIISSFLPSFFLSLWGQVLHNIELSKLYWVRSGPRREKPSGKNQGGSWVGCWMLITRWVPIIHSLAKFGCFTTRQSITGGLGGGCWEWSS